MPASDEVLRDWARHHDDYDPARSVLVRGWVRAMKVAAGPLARAGVPADVVTLAGVTCAAAATLVPRRTAAGLVVATAVLDGVDGAVARRRGTLASRGVVVDHAADRVTDVLFAVALRRAGADRRVAAAAAGATVAFEVARDGLRVARRRPTQVVTVGERPMRVAAAAAGLVTSPTAGAAAVTALAVAGAVQLVTRARSAPR